ncbi:MAG: T9SS type A sorting domain-containing protein [Flavobacteriales bacterium]
MMPIRFSFRRAALVLGASFLLLGVHAQGIFYSAGFESGSWPAEFDLGPEVERLDSDGSGTGEFVPAWRIGNAMDANAGAFFPVPNVPTGNRFAMANDDAEPCDCDLAEVALVLNAPSFVGRSGIALECRVFHERTLGGGDAFVEVSLGGGSWILLATVPVLVGDWQPLLVNLGAFDGLDDVRIRFRWSDGGNWASGFAVDDIVLRERSPNDLSIEAAHIGDPGASPFQTGDQRLAYAQIPLEQTAPLIVSAELMNRGTQALDGMNLSASVALDGTVQLVLDTLLAGSLNPGERTIIVLSSDWIPASAGAVTVTFTASSSGTDDEPTNNSSVAALRITGPGWDLGYGAMARDMGQEQGVRGDTTGFILANRMELPNSGSVVRGMSAYVTANSALGAQLRAILFDVNLAFVDTSTRYTLTQEDLDRAGSGAPLYLPFVGLEPLAAGDYFVGVQLLDGTGSAFVGLSGSSPTGAALFMQGVNFDVEYLRSTPMVRLHLEDYAVGVAERNVDQGVIVHVHPVPMHDSGVLRFSLDRASQSMWRLMDLHGREEMRSELGILGAGEHSYSIDVQGLAAGVYFVELHTDGQRSVRRVVVAR